VTENEKLRVLLAEAREVVAGVLRAADSTPYAQWSRDQHQAEIVRDAINAALAEPVKVEYSQDEVNEMTTDMIAIRKEAERAAYQRGAEVMREAAADYIRRTGWDMNPQVSCSVRTLPIPEDKP